MLFSVFDGVFSLTHLITLKCVKNTQVAVVGGGMMGRGIAACLAAGGADVAIFDVNADGVPAAVKAAEELVSSARRCRDCASNTN